MKRLTIICILAVCLGLLCAVGICVAKNLSGEFENITQSAMDNARQGNFKGACRDMILLKEKWNKTEPLMAVFCNSASLHSIEGDIFFVSALAEQGSDDFIAQATMLKYNISRIRLDEALSVESWF